MSPANTKSELEYVDTLIIGAGLSGIGLAYYLKKNCPGHRYALLESRESLGDMVSFISSFAPLNIRNKILPHEMKDQFNKDLYAVIKK